MGNGIHGLVGNIQVEVMKNPMVGLSLPNPSKRISMVQMPCSSTVSTLDKTLLL